ncbi:monooxygenase 1-like isoform X1 [Zea mays]|uniref:FAD-binding domain-containing protein n=1 Tax=Zea mays TaxID=4577 RepID=C0PLS4_MAIZE|nr:uncharacterized protein LOC100217292 isoform X1 [Zea mays]ACN36140.1 unknown [Zea mays]
MAEAEAHGIVIVGGGICGLATALALHRKGIPSLVLEKSRSLRADGAGIGVHANGWRALEQLGVAAELRETAQLITVYHDVWQQGDKTSREKVPVRSVRIVLTPVSPGANAKLAPSRVPVCKPSLLISDCLFARCCKDGAPMLKQKGPDRGTGQGHPCRRDPIRLPRRCRRCGPRRRSRRRPDNGGRYCHEGQGPDRVRGHILRGGQVPWAVSGEDDPAPGATGLHLVSARPLLRHGVPAPARWRLLHRQADHHGQSGPFLRDDAQTAHSGCHQGPEASERSRAEGSAGRRMPRRDHRDRPRVGPGVPQLGHGVLVPAAVGGRPGQLPEGRRDGRRRRHARHGPVHRPGRLGGAGGRRRARAVSGAGGRGRQRQRAREEGGRRGDRGVRQGEEAAAGAAVPRVLRHGGAAGALAVSGHQAGLRRRAHSLGQQVVKACQL